MTEMRWLGKIQPMAEENGEQGWRLCIMEDTYLPEPANVASHPPGNPLIWGNVSIGTHAQTNRDAQVAGLNEQVSKEANTEMRWWLPYQTSINPNKETVRYSLKRRDTRGIR